MILLIIRNIDFRRCCPDDNDTRTAVLLLEVADVLLQLQYHIPACLTVLDIVTIQTFGVVSVKSSLHRPDSHQFLTYRFYIFRLQDFGIYCSLIRILGIDVPRSEDDIFQIRQRNNVLIMKILLGSSSSHTDLIVLGHGADRLCKPLTCH